VEGKGCAGRCSKTWRECVEEDMRRFLLKEDAQDRAGWRSGILGDRLTRASAETNHNRRRKRMILHGYECMLLIKSLKLFFWLRTSNRYCSSVNCITYGVCLNILDIRVGRVFHI